MISKINGKLFADMIIQGAQNLSNNADLVDSLNVYPVPDGDTGTNMNLTITSGREEVENNLSQNIGELGKTFSKDYLWAHAVIQASFSLNYLEVFVKY